MVIMSFGSMKVEIFRFAMGWDMNVFNAGCE
jgi:hypothetical protein